MRLGFRNLEPEPHAPTVFPPEKMQHLRFFWCTITCTYFVSRYEASQLLHECFRMTRTVELLQYLAQFQHHLMGSYRGHAAVKAMEGMHEILGLLLNGGLPEATIRLHEMSFSTQIFRGPLLVVWSNQVRSVRGGQRTEYSSRAKNSRKNARAREIAYRCTDIRYIHTYIIHRSIR